MTTEPAAERDRQEPFGPGRLGVRAGVDLVAVEDVRRSIEQFGDRYLERVFTPHERACCTGSPVVVAAGLAARFAAKEAAIKVLEPPEGSGLPDWRSIEVRRRPSGACTLELTGEAARLAGRAGIEELAVSLSHEGAIACAVVVAVRGGPLGQDRDSDPGPDTRG